jgi:hypothetical protein
MQADKTAALPVRCGQLLLGSIQKHLLLANWNPVNSWIPTMEINVWTSTKNFAMIALTC